MLGAVCHNIRPGPVQRVRELLAAVERGELDPTTVPLAPVASALLAAARAAAEEVDDLADAAAALARLLECKAAALLPRPTATPSPEPD